MAINALPKKFPVEIRKGNSVVKIYRHTNKGYEEFKVAFYDNGQRKLETFADYSRAKNRADSINQSVCNGDLSVISLTGADRVAFMRAIEALKPTSTPLDLAAREYAKAMEILNGNSLLEAVRYFAKKHPAKLPRKTVSEVVEEFIEDRRSKKLSNDYLADVRYRGGRFADAFHCSISDISAKDIRTFIASLNLSPRSQNNFRLSINTFFGFAKSRGYLPKDHDEMASVDVIKEDALEIEIYTPEEMANLLSRARPEMVPFLVLGGFAGLRSAELERLDWSEVKFSRGVIEIKASKAKTGVRRLPPISKNLAEWLAPYASQTGRVIPFDDLGNQLRELCGASIDKAGGALKAFTWKHNALRHSYISYRVAEIQNVAQVAHEAGNSPRIIQTNYLELVTPADAMQWFSILPTSAS